MCNIPCLGNYNEPLSHASKKEYDMAQYMGFCEEKDLVCKTQTPMPFASWSWNKRGVKTNVDWLLKIDPIIDNIWIDYLFF